MIYFDNASTCKPYKEVLETYCKYVLNNFFNPSSIYKAGKNNLFLEERIKKEILNKLKLNNSKIIFTSSATESNNLAIFGYLKNKEKNKYHIITSLNEHKSVLEVFKYLEKNGFEVTYLKNKINGKIDINELVSNIRTNTIFCSLMCVNNETGEILNIKEVYEALKKHKIVFHCDMAQSFLKTDLNLLNYCDMFTISSHKIHGLKSIAALITRNNIPLNEIPLGGGQEYGLRSGTVDIPLIASFYKTICLSLDKFNNNYKDIINLFNYTVKQLESYKDLIQINTDIKNCNYFILNFSLKTVKASVVLEYLSNKEIYVSSTSACNSKNESFSYVILHKYDDMNLAKNTIRVSFSYENTKEEVDIFIKNLIEGISKLEKRGF